MTPKEVIEYAGKEVFEDAIGDLHENIARLQREREFFIQWLLIAQDTLARNGWEEGWSDEEVRHDLLLILGNLGYSPHTKKGKELRARKRRYAPIDF